MDLENKLEKQAMTELWKPQEFYNSLPGEGGYRDSRTFQVILAAKKKEFPSWPLVTSQQIIDVLTSGRAVQNKYFMLERIKTRYEKAPEVRSYIQEKRESNPSQLNLIWKPKELYDSIPGEKGYKDFKFYDFLHNNKSKFRFDWPLVTLQEVIDVLTSKVASKNKLMMLERIEEKYKDNQVVIAYIKKKQNSEVKVLPSVDSDDPLHQMWDVGEFYQFVGGRSSKELFVNRLRSMKREFFPDWPKVSPLQVTDYIFCRQTEKKKELLGDFQKAFNECPLVSDYIKKVESGYKECLQDHPYKKKPKDFTNEMPLIQSPGMILLPEARIRKVTQLSSRKLEALTSKIEDHQQEICGEKVFPLDKVILTLMSGKKNEEAKALAMMYRRPLLSIEGSESFVPPEWLE